MKSPKPVEAWALTRNGVIKTGFMWKIKRHALAWNNLGHGAEVVRVLITPIPPKRKGRRK